ncbi:MAG: hypothetical protein ACK5HT_20635 [Draconibacterium sp.]
MKKEYIVLTALLNLLLIVIISTSCSEGLSREKAKNILIKNDFVEKNLMLYNYFIWSPSLGQYVINGSHRLRNNKVFIQRLDNNGYLNQFRNGIKISFNNNFYDFLIKEDQLNRTLPVYHLIIGTLNDIEITGIEEHSDNSLTVHYIAKYEPNKIGDIFKNSDGADFKFEWNEKVLFKKFDDGWRIIK